MSARLLNSKSCFGSLLLQWYTVGWINPDDKYCTKVVPSPVWGTKFSSFIDTSGGPECLQELSLHVEVYSRDTIFHGTKLLGTCTVPLKGFLDQFENSSEPSSSRPVQELGSFHLRKKNSNKPRGFVEIFIKVSDGNEVASPSPSDYYGGFKLADHQNNGIIGLANGGHEPQQSSHPSSSSLPPLNFPEIYQPGNDQYAPPLPMYVYPHHHHPPTGGASYKPPLVGPPPRNSNGKHI